MYCRIFLHIFLYCKETFMITIYKGCILNFNFIFCPPPSWFIFVPRMKMIILMGCAPQAKNFQLFCAILKILSQLGKKYAYFWPIREKICICFSPLLSSPFEFFPNMLLRGGFKERNIHPAIYTYNKLIKDEETFLNSKNLTITSKKTSYI